VDNKIKNWSCIGVFEEGKIRVRVVKKLRILVEKNIDSRKKWSKDDDSKRKDSRSPWLWHRVLTLLVVAPNRR